MGSTPALCSEEPCFDSPNCRTPNLTRPINPFTKFPLFLLRNSMTLTYERTTVTSFTSPSIYQLRSHYDTCIWEGAQWAYNYLNRASDQGRHAVEQFFEVTSWKVEDSILDSIIGIFHWLNLSGRTMFLGSTQPLTEMSTRNIFWE